MSLQRWTNRLGGGSNSSGPPITTFAALPSAGSVPGQLRQLSDVNNTIVQSRGGIWRPYGGSQVLAMRTTNPVTVQSLTGGVAETIGPFPGGLVRAGMRLELDVVYNAGALTSANRTANLMVGNITPSAGFAWNVASTSNALVKGRMNGVIDVLSDVSATHLGMTGTAAASFANNITNITDPTVDFSQAWVIGPHFVSAAEAAVNITGATWSAGVATYTCTAHTLVTGDKTVVASVTPSGYNIAAGAVVTRIDNNTFSAPVAADPGAYTSGGTSSRISNMVSRSFVLTLKG